MPPKANWTDSFTGLSFFSRPLLALFWSQKRKSSLPFPARPNCACSPEKAPSAAPCLPDGSLSLHLPADSALPGWDVRGARMPQFWLPPLLGALLLRPCKNDRNYKAASQPVPWPVFRLCLVELCWPELHSSLFHFHPSWTDVERHPLVKEHFSFFTDALKYFPISSIC